jgi:hypothetical protein
MGEHLMYRLFFSLNYAKQRQRNQSRATTLEI